MGSMPVHSILKGPAKKVSWKRTRPATLSEVFEHTVEEYEKVKSDRNNNAAEAGDPIYSIAIENEVSQETALLFQGRRTTLSELNEGGNRVARAMLATMRNMGRGGHRNSDGDFVVVVCLEPSDTLVVALLACLKMGAAYLPVDPSFPCHRLRHILEESDPALVVTERKHKISAKASVEVEALLELAKDMSERNLEEEEEETTKTSTAIVLYTSGSTGVPKGVRLSHAAVLNRLVWQWERFPYSKTEKVCLFKTALTFVDSVSEIWGPLLSARTLLVVAKDDAKDAERIMDIVEEHSVERLVLVPTLLQSMLAYLNASKRRGRDVRLASLRLWICSGEPLSSSLVDQFYDYFDIRRHVLCNFYGSTEVMGDATYHVFDSVDEVEAVVADGRVPVGSPVYNAAVYLLDERLDPVNAGETGEVYVSGACLASGYVRDRDAGRFVDNNILVDSDHPRLYRTGDFGVIRKNVLYFKGRTDSQIKVRGNRVDVSEVDAVVKGVSGVDESAVLAYNPGREDQAVVAFVRLRGNATRAEVQAHLEATLPAYMVPHVVAVDSLPLLVNGKVDRQTLLKKYGSDHARKSDAAGAIDYSGIEDCLLGKAKDVFETVAEALGDAVRSKICADSNFYRLGGNSLNSVHFITRLRDLGYSIGIRDLLTAPSLVDVVRRATKVGSAIAMSDITDVSELRREYALEMISEKTQEEFAEIMCTSFYNKADIEAHLDPPVPFSDYEELVSAAWKGLLEGQLSFVVRNAKGEVVGAAMNKDAHKEMEMTLSPGNRLNIVFAFLDSLELPVLREKLPQGEGKILHNFMMASRTSLSTQETIELFVYMEDELLNMAKALNFVGVFSTNTSPLTQQLSRINGYRVLSEYPANRYVAQDGSRPFANAPDHVTGSVAWKPV